MASFLDRSTCNLNLEGDAEFQKKCKQQNDLVKVWSQIIKVKIKKVKIKKVKYINKSIIFYICEYIINKHLDLQTHIHIKHI